MRSNSIVYENREECFDCCLGHTDSLPPHPEYTRHLLLQKQQPKPSTHKHMPKISLKHQNRSLIVLNSSDRLMSDLSKKMGKQSSLHQSHKYSKGHIRDVPAMHTASSYLPKQRLVETVTISPKLKPKSIQHEERMAKTSLKGQRKMMIKTKEIQRLIQTTRISTIPTRQSQELSKTRKLDDTIRVGLIPQSDGRSLMTMKRSVYSFNDESEVEREEQSQVLVDYFNPNELQLKQMESYIYRDEIDRSPALR